jgi:hypothetical protein
MTHSPARGRTSSATPYSHHPRQHGDGSRYRRRLRPKGADAGSGPVELAAVMVGVFALLALVLLFGMRWLAAQAADAAAGRALEVAQSTDGTSADAQQVAARLATSSRAVSAVITTVTSTPTSVTVAVTVTSVLGSTVTRRVTGPRERFIPQAGAP